MIMSIRVILSAPGFNLQAFLREEALPQIIKLTQEFRDDKALAESAVPVADRSGQSAASVPPATQQAVMSKLKSYAAGELLNRLAVKTFQEKIVLIGAWHEAQGGHTPWKSRDMEGAFAKAKEQPPRNFARDISKAVKAGWVHAVTPRTYAVTRTGWNWIAEALQKAEAKTI